MLPRLRLGESIRVRVVELVSDSGLIVNYEGHLFRVVNQSGHDIRVNDEVSLVVTREKPLALRLAHAYRRQFERFG